MAADPLKLESLFVKVIGDAESLTHMASDNGAVAAACAATLERLDTFVKDIGNIDKSLRVAVQKMMVPLKDVMAASFTEAKALTAAFVTDVNRQLAAVDLSMLGKPVLGAGLLPATGDTPEMTAVIAKEAAEEGRGGRKKAKAAVSGTGMASLVPTLDLAPIQLQFDALVTLIGSQEPLIAAATLKMMTPLPEGVLEATAWALKTIEGFKTEVAASLSAPLGPVTMPVLPSGSIDTAAPTAAVEALNGVLAATCTALYAVADDATIVFGAMQLDIDAVVANVDTLLTAIGLIGVEITALPALSIPSMTMPVVPPLVLTIDTTSAVAQVRLLEAALADILNKLTSIAFGSTTHFGTMRWQVDATILRADLLVVALGTIATAVTAIGTAGTAGFGPLEKSLDSLAMFLGGVTAVSLPKLARVSGGLKTFVDEVSLIDTTKLDPLAKSLRSFSVFLRSINAADFAKLGAISAPFAAFANDLGTITADVAARVGKLGTAMHGLAAVRFIVPLDPALMASQGKVLADFFQNLSVISDTAATTIAKLGRAMTGLSKISVIVPLDSAAIIKQGQTLVAFFNQFNAVTDATAARVLKLGNAMRGFAAAATAGSLPSVTANFNSVNNAARAAGGGIGSLTGSFRNLFSAVGSSSGSLSMFRLGLAGIAVYGLKLFADFDDKLTKVMAHMRDWGQATRPILEAGVASVAGTSFTSTKDLASGLDELVRSGMNAAMAAKALSIAEDFAAASGMKMGEATRDLVNIQRNMAMTSTNVEEHYKNMRRISDLLVGMASRADVTTEALTKAFTPKFAQTLRMTGQSLEEGMALLTAYTEAYKDNAEGGELAGRALEMLALKGSEVDTRFKAMHIDLWDLTTGAMLPMSEIAKNINDHLGGMSTKAKYAALGFGEMEVRSIRALEALFDVSDRLIELNKNMTDVYGVTKLTADMFRKDFSGSMLILWNNVKLVAQEIGKTLAPAIAWLADGLRSVFGWFMSLNPVTRQFIIIAAVAAVALGPAIYFVGLLGGLLGGFIGTIGAVIAGFVSFAFSTTGLMVGLAGLVLTVGALVTFLGALALFGWDAVRDAVAGIGEGLMDVDWKELTAQAKMALEMIVGFFYNFEENARIIFAWLQQNWTTLLKDMGAATGIFLFNLANNIGEGVLLAIKVVGNAITWLFEGNLDKIGDTIEDVLTIVFTLIYRAMQLFLGEVGVLWKTSFSYIGTDIANAIIDGLNNALKEYRNSPFVKKLIDLGLMDAGPLTPIAKIPTGGRPKSDEVVKSLQDSLRTGIDMIIKEMQGTKIRNNIDWDLLRKSTEALIEAAPPNFRGLLEGFTPLLDTLPALKLTLPDFGKGMAEALTRNLKPTTGDAQDPMNMLGKSGPGFAFKQISQERYMLGGNLAQKIDAQQLHTLQVLVGKTDQQIAAIREQTDLMRNDQGKKRMPFTLAD